MRSFLRKLQKWLGNRQHLQAAEACEDHQPLEVIEVCEAGKQAQRDERNNQRAHALLLILSELQRTMDPEIAALVYNDRFCPLLSRLSNELLLCICDFLSGDFVTLFCLRIVSRRLLHLLDSRRRSIWGKTHPADEPVFLPCDERLEFRLLLQRDDRCNNCIQWNDARGEQSFYQCKFQPINRWATSDKLNHGMLHCYACESPHDASRFLPTYQQPLKHEKERCCLGQLGSVQLCEHVHITWASIKAYIDKWRQQQCGREDWRKYLEDFNIECCDPIHDTRCTTSEAQTWPRASLGIGRSNPNVVVLNIEWTPHRCIDALNLTVDGRMPAMELRAMFRRLRDLGPSEYLCPPSCRNPVPEMAFFNLSSEFGPFVYYKTGEDDEIGPPPASLPPLPPHSCVFLRSNHGRGINGTDLHISHHYIRDADDGVLSSQCLVIRYEKDIKICNTNAMAIPGTEMNPSHQWLHAMDIQTYPHPQGSHIRPLCRNTTCANYYKRRKDYCTDRVSYEDVTYYLG